MSETIIRHFFFFIQKTIYKLSLTFIYIYFFKNIVQKIPAVYFYLKILVLGAKLFHNIESHRDNLHFSQKIRDPKDIHIELPMLTQTSPLGLLISEKVWNRIPTNRSGQFLNPAGNHPCQSGGHLWAKCHFSIAPISKRIDLFAYDFFA